MPRQRTCPCHRNGQRDKCAARFFHACRSHASFRKTNKRVVTPPKNRMSWNACENRQFVPFWLIFVTRLLRNPAQIADFRAIFLHKTGLLCKFLSVSFTFRAVRRENSGPESEIPSPGILFSGLGISFSGLVWKNPGTETFSRRLRGRFSFPLELFPGHVSRVILSAESPGGLSRRSGFCAGSAPCSVKKAGLEGIPRHFDFRMARVAAFFPRSPGPAHPNTRISEGENEQSVNAHPKVAFCQYRRCGIPAAQSQDKS